MIDRNRDQGDLLDRRIDESLRRLYAAPAARDRVARLATTPPETLEARTRRSSILRPLLVVAAAAAILVLIRLFGGAASAPERSPASVQRVADLRVPVRGVPPAAPAAAAVCWPLIGPPEEPVRGEVVSPDLALLYRSMDACQRSAGSCGEDDFLAQRLQNTYGHEIELNPEAAGLLHGPYASAEWPTGTILTGSADNLTSVLVADSDETLACCLEMNLPEDSGLQMFTWKVGDMVLTEISPLPEPRLLQYFE